MRAGEQLAANAALVRYLKKKYPIAHMVGHMEWRQFQHLPIFKERNPSYRNAKADPGERFMKQLRADLTDLCLANARGKPGRGCVRGGRSGSGR